MLSSLFYFMEANMSEIKYYSEETISEINIAVLASSKGVKKIFFNPTKEITELSTATKLRSDDPYLFRNI